MHGSMPHPKRQKYRGPWGQNWEMELLQAGLLGVYGGGDGGQRGNGDDDAVLVKAPHSEED